MNYTTVVGPEMNGFELSVTFRKPLKSGNVTVYNRQGGASFGRRRFL